MPPLVVAPWLVPPVVTTPLVADPVALVAGPVLVALPVAEEVELDSVFPDE